MKSIKFRAWDKDTNTWLEGVTYTLHTSGRLLTKPREVELMQSTGLKDCKGKEIYEGDIVINYLNRFKGVVFFDRGSFWARECFTHVDEGIYDGDIEKETRWSIDLDYEVIGNIYENPELLETTT